MASNQELFQKAKTMLLEEFFLRATEFGVAPLTALNEALWLSENWNTAHTVSRPEGDEQVIVLNCREPEVCATVLRNSGGQYGNKTRHELRITATINWVTYKVTCAGRCR